MDKVSKRLQSLLAGDSPQRQVRLNVMLERGAAATHGDVTQRLRKLAAPGEGVDEMEMFGIVSMMSPLRSVPEIARLPGVVSVDVDGEAPLEELMDAPHPPPPPAAPGAEESTRHNARGRKRSHK